VGKSEGKGLLGTLWHRWEDNIKMIRAGMCTCAVVNTVMILQVQYNARNFMRNF
jgi:hypothetical protein